MCYDLGMAQSQSRTDTVGKTEIRREFQRITARHYANGKWLVKKSYGEWLLITPTGELAMTGESNAMRKWAFRMARITSEAARPF